MVLRAGLMVVTLSLGVAAQTPVVPTPTRDTRDSKAPAAEGTAIIRGRVVELGTGEPVRRVQIVARGGEAVSESHAAMTDDSGRFELTKLPAGRYQLSAAKGGRSEEHTSELQSQSK